MSLDPKMLESLSEQLRFAYDPLYRGYHKLMARRVRTILMVSNSYEAFSIERDSSLEYTIYGTSQALRQRVVPQITTTLSAAEGLRLLAEQRFDLVLVSANLPDMEVSEFAGAAKKTQPGVPVAMLVFDGRSFDLAYGGTEPAEVDWIFAWRGSASVIVSIIKLVEDRANVDTDIQLAAIGTIVVIEDSVERYSALLPPLFTTLLTRTFDLIPEGVNESERQVRSRVRPKVLLARTFAEAAALVEKYQSSLLAIISDLRTYHDDRVDPHSGPRFLRDVRTRFPAIPILVQSSEPDGAATAAAIDARFLDKSSTKMAAALEQFVLDDVGFGSFAFRDAQGGVHARVTSLWEMEEAIARVPDESLLFASDRNELSHWFRARGESTLAAIVRPLSAKDFATTFELREYLRSAIAIARRERHRGVIADFQAAFFDPSYPFLVIGRGSLGGKGRGLAFMFHMLSRELKDGSFDGMRVRLPSTLVIATSEFDAFLHDNDLDPAELATLEDDAIRRRFAAARLPERVVEDLRIYLSHVTTPLAVRSSSILEDSHYQPCAGLYATYFLPNSHLDRAQRLTQLCQAVALVYASVFLKTPRQYHAATGVNAAEEKMAVVIQEVIGEQHGDLFYPTFSGVAQSQNFYPVFDMRPEDGVATLALGLGKHVVEGGEAVRFCPKYPRVIPQFSSLQATLKSSQRDFFALDLSGSDVDLLAAGSGPATEGTLVRQPLARAEADGVLQEIGSVVSLEDDRIYDGVYRRGARVVTFSRILRNAEAPLCRLLRHLLEVGKRSFGCALEMEFAGNIKEEQIDFGFLQIRPFVAQREARRVSLDNLAPDKTLCRCRRAMGDGSVEGVRDVVYVHPERFERAQSREVAKLIEQVNTKLVAARRPYVLIGPGRFGTLDQWLGIPVMWHQISAARVIIEVPARDLEIEPSQGTHFFHNMVSGGVGYLSLGAASEGEFVRWEMLEALPSEEVAAPLRHVRLPQPLVIRIDGRAQQAVIALGPA